MESSYYPPPIYIQLEIYFLFRKMNNDFVQLFLSQNFADFFASRDLHLGEHTVNINGRFLT